MTVMNEIVGHAYFLDSDAKSAMIWTSIDAFE